MSQTVILYTTWPDAETAEAAAEAAVTERLAACANIYAPMRSIYRWQGAVERAAEVAMTLKTSRQAAPALKGFLLARHPYDLPCVIAIAIDEQLSHADFLAWVAQETNGGAEALSPSL